MKPVRKARVSSFLRTEISRVIQHELRDPRIGFVSVTSVEPTEDLKEARVSISVLGDESQQRTTLRGLEAARGFIQSHLAKVSSFRETPILQFVLDESIRKQMEIEARIREVRALDDEAPAEGEPAGDHRDEDLAGEDLREDDDSRRAATDRDEN